MSSARLRPDALARLAVAASVGCVLSAACASKPTERSGAFVEGASKRGAAARAGVRPGDLLLGWQAGARAGPIRSPFDLALAELEEGASGPLSLQGLRDSAPVVFTLQPGDWGLYARPVLIGEALRRYQDAQALLVTAGPQPAGFLEALGRDLARLASPLDSAAALLSLGRGLAALRRWPECEEAYRAAGRETDAAHDPLASASLADAAGDAAEAHNDFAGAQSAYRRALGLREAARKDSLAVASSLATLARLAHYRGDLEAAEPLWQKALALAAARGNQSFTVAACRVGLGGTLLAEGRMGDAEDLYQQALVLMEGLAPGSPELGETLSGLGLVARQRGDLAQAESLYRQSLALEQSLDPASERVGSCLNRLGVVAKERGQLEEADAFYRRALAIFEPARPAGIEVAGCLNNLGNLARLRHDERAAEDFHRRALAIREALAPDSLDVAASLQNLAEVSRDRGDWRAAEPLYRRALAIKKKRAPDSLTFAATLLGLAESAAIREDLAGSLDLHQQALAIRSRLAPGSTAESDSLFAVGSCLRRLGRPQQAVERLRLSIAALEAQRVRLGSTGLGQSGFALLAAGAYEELIDLLVELDRIEEAFAVLERSRARGLLALLAERDIAFAADVPAPLEAEQRRDDAEYDRALDRLGQKSDPREIAGLRLQLAELRDRQLQIAARIRQASPRLAALQFPEPLDLAGVQAALDPGTLLLSYAVGKQRAFLFVVTARGTGSAAAAGLKAVRIPLGEDALRDRVLAFRALVDRGKQGAASDPALLTQGARLYDLLLRPAEAWIDGAQRILIVPGGPLAALPFAALVQSSEPRRYVAEWKPLHTIASATVYAEILKDRRSWSGASPTLVAFADPERPPRVGLAGSDALVARADALGSLPYARLEVQQIAELFGDAALTYLGAAATEERASSLGQGPRYIHFACHAVLDPRFPLESALVLSRPARVSTPLGDNGLLQAWEIFARVRIDADLVTLSACETALGGERAAEGLLGLSRAFQYAGAHSVLASLWELSDRSTPSLMQSFYRGLRQGLPKDEALQAAELQAIRAGAPPFEWAAFELSGDWK